MRPYHTTFRGLRGALLEALVEGPPLDANDKWFCEDLQELSFDELRDEARRLELRLLLTPRLERDHWPACWLVDRLERARALLRRHHAASGWSRTRRR